MVTFTITASARRFFKVVDKFNASPQSPGDLNNPPPPDNPLQIGETWEVVVTPTSGTGQVDIYYGTTLENMTLQKPNEFPIDGKTQYTLP